VEYGAWAGWIGGLLGSFIGLLGGVFGTWMSIRNTKGPRERALMVRASVECWVLVTTFLVLLIGGQFVLPAPYKFLVHLLWLPYGFLLMFGIRRWNAAQARIRQDESGASA
jgi:hypothetical protein